MRQVCQEKTRSGNEIIRQMLGIEEKLRVKIRETLTFKTAVIMVTLNFAIFIIQGRLRTLTIRL